MANGWPRFAVGCLAAVSVCAFGPSVSAAEDARAGVEFFEKKVRPALAEHCYSCHSKKADKRRGGLLLDSHEGILKGGDSGPVIVPGKPDKSLLIQAVRQEQDLRMPPKNKLPESVITALERWVRMGAPGPLAVSRPHQPRRSEFRITEEDRRHWAFQPVADAMPPRVRAENWCRSPIDRFIVARLEAKGLPLGEPVNRHALLRRATFDLTGLPPTPKEIEAFLRDDSPRAFEKVVDRLLASKEFGVRWARHWLDGVRYASDVDKSGRYRDWVVRAFNADLPYDQFVRMQVAGDLIPASATDPAKVHVSGASLDGVTATGMLALATWEKVGRDLAVAEIVDSQIDVVGRQLLGLTLACARCHDHKFDPISARDYYALSGIFFSSHISPGKLIADGRLSDEVIGIPLLTKADAAKNRRIDEQIAGVQKQIDALEVKAGPAARLRRVRGELADLDAKLKKAKGADKKKLKEKADKLRAEEKKLLADHKKNGWPLDPPELVEVARLDDEIADLKKTKVSPPRVIGIQEGGIPGSNREKIGDAPIYLRGDYRKEGPVVPRRFPVILAGDDQTPLGRRTSGSGRLELANWITAPDNPLTARVMVNRVWMRLFGEGLVRTPDNFGKLGERPTHPELLDYLTRRFVKSGWSVKRLVRAVMLSSAYRQSSFADRAVHKADPENRLLGRMNRKRLEYEALRDSILLAGGQLSRRTLYEPIERKRADPARMIFDGPDPLSIVPERAATTTTPQALYLMNSPLVAQAAKALAERLKNDPSLKDNSARIRAAYLRLLGRPPSPEEIRIGRAYLAKSPWANYVQLLMCTNEFMYLD